MCSKCDSKMPIVNSHFKLCQDCNNIRLHGNKWGKQSVNTNKEKKVSRKSLFIKERFESTKKIVAYSGGIRSKSLGNFILDELFYEKCFNSSDHKCEECGDQLPTEFRDEDGKIIARWRYSHIVAKSIAPELRHTIKNINHLCLKHHTQWDFGKKKEMKIYEKNKKRLPKFF